MRAGALLRPSLTRPWGALALPILVTALALPGPASGASSGHAQARGLATQSVSVNSSGALGNADSGRSLPGISANGRYVAFQSSSSNLVADDANGVDDVFVHDRRTGITDRISVDSHGNEGNRQSRFPAISHDGRYVVFVSGASNLVRGDTNSLDDVFVRDRWTGTTARLSVDSGGNQANGYSTLPAISGNGRYIAFYSTASNLVPGDTNHAGDIFVHDRQSGLTERVSVDNEGNQANGDSYFYIALSQDGRYVAFGSKASNLVPGDTNGTWDAFVRDRRTGTTERVSVSSAGEQGNSYTVAAPAISANGRYIAFASLSSNLVAYDTQWTWDVFVRDRWSGTTERVSVSGGGQEGNGSSGLPGISADGRYITFASYASNLVPADSNGSSDVFVFDRLARTTTRVSLDSVGTQGNAWSGAPAISANARYAVFGSDSTNLTVADTNGVSDVFVRHLLPGNRSKEDYQ